MLHLPRNPANGETLDVTSKPSQSSRRVSSVDGWSLPSHLDSIYHVIRSRKPQVLIPMLGSLSDPGSRRTDCYCRAARRRFAELCCEHLTGQSKRSLDHSAWREPHVNILCNAIVVFVLTLATTDIWRQHTLLTSQPQTPNPGSGGRASSRVSAVYLVWKALVW